MYDLPHTMHSATFNLCTHACTYGSYKNKHTYACKELTGFPPPPFFRIESIMSMLTNYKTQVHWGAGCLALRTRNGRLKNSFSPGGTLPTHPACSQNSGHVTQRVL